MDFSFKKVFYFKNFFKKYFFLLFSFCVGALMEIAQLKLKIIDVKSFFKTVSKINRLNKYFTVFWF